MLVVWAVMKANLFLLLMDILRCSASKARSDFSYHAPCLLPLLVFLWSEGLPKQLPGNFQVRMEGRALERQG